MQTTNSKGCVAYVWSHFALRPIQQGIQSAHVCTKLAMESWQCDIAKQWATKDFTVMFFTGGNSKGLSNIEALLMEIFYDSDIPYAAFSEDEDTLKGIRTAVGCILPGEIVEILESKGEDSAKRIAAILIANYNIGKVKASSFKKLVDLITKSRWAG